MAAEINKQTRRDLEREQSAANTIEATQKSDADIRRAATEKKRSLLLFSKVSYI